MKKNKKLENALSDVDKLPDSWFGNEKASFEDLPSVIKKKETVRTSIYLRKEDLAFLKSISKKTKVPVAELQGDIIAKYVEQCCKNQS